ncbi:baseplate J/gp47 family protein [Pseudomonas sp. L5B5]|uniref:baseplate J/gp47 family protein n=1 Tax=Pseudomonas sp. L5B5 TaxID=2883205 RepID=UPI001CF9BF0E|nr:baseplate J/gp47 family protein [Pseudomonas sp. L5B5]UCZ84466.1 baseplate J/gp47 family protein [Pseudomonas sp. L5B5]
MAISVLAFESILGNILRDIRNLQPEADIGKDSDNYARSAAFAAAVEGLYQKVSWVYRQIFADTADDEELLHHAAIQGLFQKGSVAATASVLLSGAPGVNLLQGSTLTHVATGEKFATTSSAQIGQDGTVAVGVSAIKAGFALNGLSGELVVNSPPLAMSGVASFVSETIGGDDQEKTESLRGRLLELIQSPPAGGTAYDFKRWARSVDGVTDALVLPMRRGAGTVDVVITTSSGSPSAEVIANCKEFILGKCSVIADVWVYAPVVRTVDSTALVELEGGYKLVDVQAAAQVAYNALLGALKPREILRRSQIEAMLNNLAGVTDRSVTAPAGNVKASEDASLIGWIRPGTIKLGLMR